MVRAFTSLFTEFVKFISLLFMIGIAGSTVVLLMTAWEDVQTMFGKS